MSDNTKCRCPRCTIRSLLGPAVIVTVGVLFLLQQMRGGYFDFGNTYPVILVVIGAILLASSLAPMDGHINPEIQQQVPPRPPTAPGPTTPQSTYQSPYSGQGQ
jgi:cell wall-active antibiotic response 4TMS protein YvqF